MGHLCDCLEDAWKRGGGELEHVHTEWVHDFADGVLNDLGGPEPLHIGTARISDRWWAYVLHENGVDLVRLVVELSEAGDASSHGFERRFVAPRQLDYREQLVDFRAGMEKEFREKGKPPFRDNEATIGLRVIVKSRDLDKPIRLRIEPNHVDAFDPVRQLLREWSRLPRQRP